MLIIIPIFLLLIVPVVMLAIRLLQPRFNYHWLIAAGTGLLAWTMLMLARGRLPQTIPLASWEPNILFPTSPALLVDDISWPIATALVALFLASVLTDAGRDPESTAARPDWSTWASSMALTAISLFAVLAENLLTLLLGWAAIDMAELIAWIVRARERRDYERIVLAYSARVAGVLVIIGAGMVATASGSPLGFTTINPRISVYLLVAAGLRLGVLPPTSPLPKNITQYSGRGVLLRLAPAATSLALLPRAGIVGAPAPLSTYLLWLSGLAALYGGLAWLSAKDETDGQPYWILASSALTLASASRAQVEASLAWGITTLLAGGLVFLAHARRRQLAPLLLLGTLSLTTLPFTPTWQAVRLYSQPLSASLLLLPFGHALLLGGHIRHSLRPGKPLTGAERWVWAIYPWGLALLLLTHYTLGWWSWRQTALLTAGRPDWMDSWPALASGGLTVLLVAWGRQSRKPPVGLVRPFEGAGSLLYRAAWGAYYAIRRAFALISMLLEGQAGILWTLLLLALLLSVLAQGRLAP